MASDESKGQAIVLGGAGFLGSHLCERLLVDGFAVLCVDNLLTGRLQNVSHLLKHPRFAFSEQDVARALDAGGPVAGIFHLASPASPPDYGRFPIETMRANALGAHNALELARRMGARVLLASTSEVYGDPEVSPQPESYWGRVNPVGPRSVYDEAKRYAEALTVAYHRRHGLDVRIARIFNVYGSRMRPDDGRVLPTFMLQAIRHEPITVFGDGSQTRSLCHVDDMVEGLLRLYELRVPSPPTAADGLPPIVNLGNPEEVTVLTLAKEIITLVGSKSTIVFHPLPADDPRQRRPDIMRAEALLGWRPAIARAEGLRRVLPYFRALEGGHVAPEASP